MAISRVPGPALLSNLDRQGLDLQFTTLSSSLVYMDFANFRLGINTASPQQALHVIGNVLITNGHAYTDSDITYDLGSASQRWRHVYAGDLTGTLATAAQPNVTSLGTLSSLNVGGNITVGQNILPSINLQGTIGSPTRYWEHLYANVIDTSYLFATLLTAEQPFISTLGNITVNQAAIGNLSVSNISIANSISLSGNLSLNRIDANLIFENGSRVLTYSSNIIVTGDVTGYGTYTNIALSLPTTGVTPGVYGSADDEIPDRVPKITVDNKGRITNIANVALTQIANIRFSNTTISSNANITVTTTGGNVTFNLPGTGTVKVLGDKAIGIPYGNIITRPTVVDIGYLRYNTELQSVEWWNGNTWQGPGDRSSISSETIIPDGISNNYFLQGNATTNGTIVNINGTMQQPANLIANTGSYYITGNVITFLEPPLATDIVEVRRIEVGVINIESINNGVAEVRASGANVVITGNLYPNGNLIYNLGSPTSVWKNAYVDNIYITGNVVSQIPISISSGGTGASTREDALENLLPDGEVAGYVLVTGGAGSYYWANANITGGGSGTGGGTRIDTARLYETASASQTVFTTPEYVIGSNQLKVFINGVRQFAGAYTETSNTSITFSTGLRSGTQVLTEVDTYKYYTVNAANIEYTPSGSISANTVAGALAELDAEKVGTGGAATIEGILTANSGTLSTTVTTGALVVRGGAGISGNINAWAAEFGTNPGTGNVVIKKGFQGIYTDGADFTLIGGSDNPARSYVRLVYNSGTTIYAGDPGAGGNIILDGGTAYSVVVSRGTESTSTTTGALVVTGGQGIGGNLFAGSNAAIRNTVTIGTTPTATSNLWVRHTTPATSTATGALRVEGGAGINGNLYLGGNLVMSAIALGTVTAGEKEYDGSVFYATQDTTSGRGVLLAPRYFRLTANIGTPAAGQGPAIAWVFGPTSNISLAANSLYEIEWNVFLLKQAAGTLTWQITNNNNPPQFVHASYIGPPVAGNVAVGTPQYAQNYNVTTANTALPATGTITLNTWHRYTIRALLLSNASVGGKIGLQVTQSLGTMVTLAGSTIKVTRLPTASATGVFGN